MKKLTKDDIDFKRPGTGISPDRLDILIGRKLKRRLEADRMISLEDLY